MPNTVSIGGEGCTIGGDGFIVIAGPCAVECEEQIMRTAEAVAAGGGHMLRGGAFKPRTSPYAFQGLGEQGLKLLAKARAAFGLPVVTEVMAVRDVELVAEYADMLQIGSRSMENWALLDRASRSGRPLLLKRGMTATIDEVVEAALFVRDRGGEVVICERGIRCFETATRNTCDLAAVPLLQQRSGVPVIVDPSHATGLRELVPPIAKAAAAIGADGLIIEIHPDPEAAWSDGRQSLSLEQYLSLMERLRPHIALWRSERSESVLHECVI